MSDRRARSKMRCGCFKKKRRQVERKGKEREREEPVQKATDCQNVCVCVYALLSSFLLFSTSIATIRFDSIHLCHLLNGTEWHHKWHLATSLVAFILFFSSQSALHISPPSSSRLERFLYSIYASSTPPYDCCCCSTKCNLSVSYTWPSIYLKGGAFHLIRPGDGKKREGERERDQSIRLNK